MSVGPDFPALGFEGPSVDETQERGLWKKWRPSHVLTDRWPGDQERGDPLGFIGNRVHISVLFCPVWEGAERQAV